MMYTFEPDVIVIGAGFSGCYLLHTLRKQGFRVKVLEWNARIGGVWAWSTYPGARVDHEQPLYGFSDREIWESWKWNERFASGSTMRAYFDHLANKWDLHKDVELSTKVISAIFDESASQWQVTCEDGRVYRSQHLVSAVGTSSKPKKPSWKGLDKFKGELHHTAEWPVQSIPPEGKRMAVIGAGASGVQVMQEAGRSCSTVTHFIRTPNIALPMGQRAITAEEIYAYKPLYTHIFRACRNTINGLAILDSGKGVFCDTPEDRNVLFEEVWERGGFNFVQGAYNDYLVDKAANREMYRFWCQKTRAKISDPIKRDILAPLEPPYWFATKRPSMEQDYYEVCDRPHVEISTSPIVEFTETGIKTEDGTHREFDIVAVCTGYDAIIGGLKTMGIKGRAGLALEDKWKTGVKTNLGMMVHGFPNFFMLYGPQAPTSVAVAPVFIERQCEWLLEVLLQQRSQGIRTLEVTQEAEDTWVAEVTKLANSTLLVETDSWAMGVNNPEQPRECLLYLGGMPTYFKHCQESLSGWRDFQLTYEHEAEQ